jgi:hypothetical protein
MQYIYYRIKELCIKLVIKTSLYYDAQSEKHHIFLIVHKLVVKKHLELSCILGEKKSSYSM